MARPTEYNSKRPGQAEFICEHWGADDVELAKALGISPATLYEWKKEHPEFSEAVARGKAAYDNAKVSRAVVASAVGYEYTEEIWDSKNGVIVRVKKWRHADPRAQALWMMNRQGWQPPGAAKQLAAGGAVEACDDGTSPGDGRAAELAKEILERRHGTKIHVASREVEAGASDVKDLMDERDKYGTCADSNGTVGEAEVSHRSMAVAGQPVDAAHGQH